MQKTAARSFRALLVVLAFGAEPVHPCSTFMISREECLVVAHNVDQSFVTPGMIHINRRGERKRSVSTFDLHLREGETPIVDWSSKYGSVTFGMLGRNLPDGGMNEAGLTVSEMGLGESRFGFDASRPAMLSHLWIQYQLDNYATVDEVLDHLDDINIETSSTFTPPASSNYHLFVTDRAGRFAVIEFLQGGPRVYRDEMAPVPVLCNETYEKELEKLDKHTGFTGWIRRNLNSREDLRFVTGALAVEAFDPDEVDAVTYSFETLHAMQFDWTKRWSVIYDVRNLRVHFETARGGERGFLDFEDLDFGADARPLVLADIHLDRGGDVSGDLAEFSREIDRAMISRFLRSLVRFVAKSNDPVAMDRHMQEHYGLTVERYIDRALETSELVRVVEQ